MILSVWNIRADTVIKRELIGLLLFFFVRYLWWWLYGVVHLVMLFNLMFTVHF
jgi:hypothetical protein